MKETTELPTVLLEVDGDTARAEGTWLGIKWRIYAERLDDYESRCTVHVVGESTLFERVADVTVHAAPADQTDETQRICASSVWSRLRALKRDKTRQGAARMLRVRIAIAVDDLAQWQGVGWWTADADAAREAADEGIAGNGGTNVAYHWVEVEIPVPLRPDETVIDGALVEPVDFSGVVKVDE